MSKIDYYNYKNKIIQRYKRRTLLLFVLILCVIIPIGLLATSCQSTPEEMIIIPKDNAEKTISGESEKESNVTKEANQYKVPERWTDEFVVEGEYTKNIKIDAAINMPDVDAFPVAEIKATNFNQIDLEPIINYFVGDETVVEIAEPTQDDLTDQIIRQKQYFFENNKNPTPEEQDFNNWMIESLEERRKTAPVETELIYITDYTLGDEAIQGEFLDSVGGISIDTDAIYIQKSISTIVSGSIMRYKGVFGNDTETRLPKDDEYKRWLDILEDEQKVKETQTKAIEIAEGFLGEVGITGACIESVERAYLSEWRINWYDSTPWEYEKNKFAGGFIVTFVRGYDGLTPPRHLTNDLGGYASSDWELNEYEYRQPMYHEGISITINEQGEIVGFSWVYPTKIGEVISENVELMPFDQVQERLKQLIEYVQFDRNYVYQNNQRTDLAVVSEVDLYLNFLPIKNNPNKYMYVPCWYITLEEQYQNKECDPELYCSKEYFAINAIDGGFIDVNGPSHIIEE